MKSRPSKPAVKIRRGAPRQIRDRAQDHEVLEPGRRPFGDVEESRVVFACRALRSFGDVRRYRYGGATDLRREPKRSASGNVAVSR
jgi:hypothetical protein